MKVLVACVESGSLKEYLFTKDTDTSIPDTTAPECKTFLAEKYNPVVKFIQTPYGIVLARKKGYIGLYSYEYEPIQDIGSATDLIGFDVVGDSLYYVDKSGNGLIYNFDTKESSILDLPNDLSVAIKHPSAPVILYSGPTLRPEIRSLDGEIIFQARNPKAKLDLQERNLVTNAVFLPNENKDTYKFATITSHGKVRVYDSGVGKKPVQQVEISKYGLKALALVDDNKLAIGDTQSKVGLYQINPTVKLVGNYKGVIGATSSITERKDLICAVGLDRYIRVFVAGTRDPAGKVYVGEELEWAAIMQDDTEKHALDEDEFWDELKSVSKKRKVAKPEKEEIPSEDSVEEEELLGSEDEEEEEYSSDFDEEGSGESDDDSE